MKARKPTPMKTYKFKLYSNHGNRELHKTIEGHVSVWNHCVALQRRYYALYGKYISKFRLMQHIGKLKKTCRFAHWNALPSQAVQDVAARIDKGYKAMFAARAKGQKWGRPRDRTWQCPNCHTQLDRDRNAAVNIFRVGASTPAGEDVSPDSSGNPC